MAQGRAGQARSGSLSGPAREFTKAYWERRNSTWANTYWRGIPVQKLALDLWVLQEIIQSTRPDGRRRDRREVRRLGRLPRRPAAVRGRGRVISVDSTLDVLHDDVREDDRIQFVEGDSVEAAIVAQVRGLCGEERVMVVLDSDHHAPHVRAELDAYAGLVAEGCYVVVEDTIVNGNPILPDFGPGPGEAVASWIETHPEFEIDRSREHLMATFHPGGYLRRL